jgi:flagellar biosynthesis protein FliP
MAELELPGHMTAWLLLAALPLLLAACTAFTKISIVLAALRIGLGAQTLLPFGSMLALSLVLTALAMAPVGEALWLGLEQAGGLAALQLAPLGAWLDWLAPLHEFLTEHAAPDDRRYFAELAGLADDHPLALVPAFMIGELGRGLELAMMVLLPFVVVDLVAAQVMVLLGTSQTPSAVLALPAKLLLFVTASGWQTIVGGLIEGYR